MKASSLAYDLAVLSEDEKRRFFAALGDGFGNSRSRQHLGSPLPATMEPGLLMHEWYRPKSEDFGGLEEEGHSAPSPFVQCPVTFHLPALRQYFDQQKAAYLERAKSLGEFVPFDESPTEHQFYREKDFYGDVVWETYSKAWYEFHINQCISFIDDLTVSYETVYQQDKSRSSLEFMLMTIADVSGQLGRLVEQYYWKFLLEKAAIRGERISESAKSGGLVLASKRKKKHVSLAI